MAVSCAVWICCERAKVSKQLNTSSPVSNTTTYVRCPLLSCKSLCCMAHKSGRQSPCYQPGRRRLVPSAVAISARCGSTPPAPASSAKPASTPGRERPCSIVKPTANEHHLPLDQTRRAFARRRLEVDRGRQRQPAAFGSAHDPPPKGCSLIRSRLAVKRKSSFSATPDRGLIATTLGLRSVSVPVLSIRDGEPAGAPAPDCRHRGGGVAR